jgi:crotonobetainyl-CoA:carnitine CoA-transferase CaiB-like acyl-CoA transferase
MTMPLEGITVLDLTRLAPGPYCTMILADLGADVIKIEEPGPPTGRRAEQAGGLSPVPPRDGVDRHAPHWALNRNKKTIGLNLKHDQARQIFYRLAEQADETAGDRLRHAAPAQPTPDLLRGDRLRPERSLPRFSGP